MSRKPAQSARFSSNILQVRRRLLSLAVPAAWKSHVLTPYEISGLDEDDYIFTEAEANMNLLLTQKNITFFGP